MCGLHVPCVSLGFPHYPKSTSELEIVSSYKSVSLSTVQGTGEPDMVWKKNGCMNIK